MACDTCNNLHQHTSTHSWNVVSSKVLCEDFQLPNVVAERSGGSCPTSATLWSSHFWGVLFGRAHWAVGGGTTLRATLSLTIWHITSPHSKEANSKQIHLAYFTSKRHLPVITQRQTLQTLQILPPTAATTTTATTTTTTTTTAAAITTATAAAITTATAAATTNIPE